MFGKMLIGVAEMSRRNDAVFRAVVRADDCAEKNGNDAEMVCRNRAVVGAEQIAENGSNADAFAEEMRREG